MAKDADKLDLILVKLGEMDQRLSGVDQRLAGVERKLDVIALTLLAPAECQALGIGKKPPAAPAPKRSGASAGSGTSDMEPLPMAAKGR
jgi:hypothetical protein